MPIKYGDLVRQHPDYKPDYWRVCELLYEGGSPMTWDRSTLERIFPRHANELDDIYEERVCRAYFTGYSGEIINYLVAALFAEPIKMKSDPQADPFYDQFSEDTSIPGGNCIPLNRLLRQQILTALQKQTAWTLIDLPNRGDRDDSYESPRSEAEEEEQGLLRAYSVPLCPESVIDWEEDHDGRLIWANVCLSRQPRLSLDSQRDRVIETYTIYTFDGWIRYRIDRDIKRSIPLEADMSNLSKYGASVEFSEGDHDFGAVPLIQLKLPCGLWAMNKLESMAREHFNQSNALSWAMLRSMFPQLYEFLGTEMPQVGKSLSEAQQDPGRALAQIRGMGYVQTRGADDKASYIGPDSSPFKFAQDHLASVRDEMHRVTHLMALSVDNKAQTVSRSGASKAHDRAATSVVLTELGNYVRRHSIEIFEMVGRGRKDPKVTWTAHGMENFDQISVDDAADEMVKLATFRDLIKAPTYWRKKAEQWSRLDLGPNLSDEDMERIEEELKRSESAESMLPMGADPSDPDQEQKQDPGTQDPANAPLGDDKDPDQDQTDTDNMEVGGQAIHMRGTSSAGIAHTVYNQLLEDFDESLLGWVLAADWKGPLYVPTSSVDTSNRDMWRASDEPDEVNKFADRNQSGQEKPIVLVNEPNDNKLIIVDGHHRFMAAEKLGKPVLAFVGNVSGVDGPWKTMHEDQRKSEQSTYQPSVSAGASVKEMEDALDRGGAK